VIERTEAAGKEPLQHRLLGDVDAFAACRIAEPNECRAQFLGQREANALLGTIMSIATTPG
jgi:hypothetical protein